MRDSFLSFSPPAVTEAEIEAVVATLRSGWITTGPTTRRFEEEFAEYVGAPAALACNSWTAAAHAGLHAMGIGPGDEVIVPTLTFAATANIVEHVGARPVFVDVDDDTLNMSIDSVERAMTAQTRAIIPVHYAGHPVELDALEELAERRNVHILEDAAHAVAARFRGRLIGSGPSAAAFSFYATKNLTTGEGGMLVGEPDLLDRARRYSLHGMSRDAWSRYDKGGSWSYEVMEPGFKFNMSDIQAAMGRVQLERLAQLQVRREEIVALYDAGLAAIPGLRLPETRPHVSSANHLYVVRVQRTVFGMSRSQFIDELAKRNVGSSVHFVPVHRHPYYRDKYSLSPARFPVAEAAFEEIVSLPLSPAFADSDVQDVIDAIHDVAESTIR